MSEVYRAGIDSIHAGQTAAALSLGLTRQQTLRFVIVPQAVRRVLPPLLNDFIALQKDVALVSVLGPAGGARRVAQISSDYHFNYTPFVAAALVYLCVTIPLIRIVDHSSQARRRSASGRPPHAVSAAGPRACRGVTKATASAGSCAGSTSKSASTRRWR